MIVIQLTLNEYLSYTWHWWWTRLSVCLIKQIRKQPWEENNRTSAFVEMCCRCTRGSTMSSGGRVEGGFLKKVCFQDYRQWEVKCWQRGRLQARGVSIQDLGFGGSKRVIATPFLLSPLPFHQQVGVETQVEASYHGVEQVISLLKMQGSRAILQPVFTVIRIPRLGRVLPAVHTMPFSLQRQVGVFSLQNWWAGAECACL